MTSKSKGTDESRRFAAALSGWRLSRSLSQEEFAQATGVSHSSISQAERAIHPGIPKPITLSKMANYLGITVEQLCAGPGSYVSLKRDPSPATEATPTSLATIRKCEACGTDGPAFITVPAHWIGAQMEPGELRCMPIGDASMSPQIEPGDLLLLKPGPDLGTGHHLIQAGSTNKLLVRRLSLRADGQVKVSCDNPQQADESFVTDPDKLKILAQVVFAVRGFKPV